MVHWTNHYLLRMNKGWLHNLNNHYWPWLISMVAIWIAPITYYSFLISQNKGERSLTSSMSLLITPENHDDSYILLPGQPGHPQALFCFSPISLPIGCIQVFKLLKSHPPSIFHAPPDTTPWSSIGSIHDGVPCGGYEKNCGGRDYICNVNPWVYIYIVRTLCVCIYIYLIIVIFVNQGV